MFTRSAFDLRFVPTGRRTHTEPRPWWVWAKGEPFFLTRRARSSVRADWTDGAPAWVGLGLGSTFTLIRRFRSWVGAGWTAISHGAPTWFAL